MRFSIYTYCNHCWSHRSIRSRHTADSIWPSMAFARTEYQHTDAEEDVHTTEFNSPYQSVGMGYVSVLCFLKKKNNSFHFMWTQITFMHSSVFTFITQMWSSKRRCFHVACKTHFFNMMCRGSPVNEKEKKRNESKIFYVNVCANEHMFVECCTFLGARFFCIFLPIL